MSVPPAGSEASGELFGSLIRAPHRKLFPIACSMVLHAVSIAGVVLIFDAVPPPREGLSARYTVRMIRFDSPPLFAPRIPKREGGATAAAAGASAGGRNTVPDSSGAAAEAAPAPAPSPSNAPRRMFQLPEAPRQTRSAQILLQPEDPLTLPPNRDLRVPELLLWKPRPPAPPARKVFVAQKRAQEPAKPQSLPAPPVLQSPGDAPQIADLAFSGQFTRPAPLTLPAGTTAPMQTGGREQGPPPQVASAKSENPDSPNILSIPDMPVPAMGVFAVPAGNQGADSGSGSGGTSNGKSGQTAATFGRAGGTGSGGGTSMAGSGGNAHGAGAGGHSINGTAGGAGDGARGGRGSTISGPSGGSPGPGGGDGANGGGNGGPGAHGGFGLVDGRQVAKVTLPPEGHFNVLIQSSGSEAYPEAEGVLSGKMIYTVYIRAGARKEWILQYSLPRAAEQRIAATGKVPPLEAPFPFVMLRPDFSYGDDIDYLIVHGTVTPIGKFEQLSYVIAPQGKTDKDLLMHSLEQWQIRPGRLDGQPVSLEVLLIIPREGS